MLSICIPVYNFPIETLTLDLKAQMQQLDVPIELVLIDDASSNFSQSQNKNAFYLADKFVPLQNNVGRAKIRNLFLEHARFPFLLFLDCDAKIHRTHFLQEYVQFLLQNETAKVVCGGRVYPEKLPSESQALRWHYGWRKESRNAKLRSLEPHRSFMTNNFLIHRSVFQNVRFDEQITKYGHEDTLFGFELSKLKYQIHHIENPVMNDDIETNEVFLQKTEAGLENLRYLYQRFRNDRIFIQNIKILSTYHRFQSTKTTFLLRCMDFFIGKILRRSLEKKCTSMLVFDLYKLLYLSR